MWPVLMIKTQYCRTGASYSIFSEIRSTLKDGPICLASITVASGSKRSCSMESSMHTPVTISLVVFSFTHLCVSSTWFLRRRKEFPISGRDPGLVMVLVARTVLYALPFHSAVCLSTPFSSYCRASQDVELQRPCFYRRERNEGPPMI